MSPQIEKSVVEKSLGEAGFDNQVSRIEVFLKEGGTEVAPAVNGIYTYEVRFTHSA